MVGCGEASFVAGCDRLVVLFITISSDFIAAKSHTLLAVLMKQETAFDVCLGASVFCNHVLN